MNLRYFEFWNDGKPDWPMSKEEVETNFKEKFEFLAWVGDEKDQFRYAVRFLFRASCYCTLEYADEKGRFYARQAYRLEDDRLFLFSIHHDLYEGDEEFPHSWIRTDLHPNGTYTRWKYNEDGLPVEREEGTCNPSELYFDDLPTPWNLAPLLTGEHQTPRSLSLVMTRRIPLEPFSYPFDIQYDKHWWSHFKKFSRWLHPSWACRRHAIGETYVVACCRGNTLKYLIKMYGSESFSLVYLDEEKNNRYSETFRWEQDRLFLAQTMSWEGKRSVSTVYHRDGTYTRIIYEDNNRTLESGTYDSSQTKVPPISFGDYRSILHSVDQEPIRVDLFPQEEDEEEKGEEEPVNHSPALLEAVKLLEERAEKVYPYFTYEFGGMKDPHGFSAVGPSNWAEETIAFLRPRLPEGILCFIGTDNWCGSMQWKQYNELNFVELVLSEGKEPWDILRLARTNALNYDMDTEDLIQELQKLYDEAPFTIQKATTDTLILILDHPPRDIPAYCEKLYELCPDIVDQGVGSVEHLKPLVESCLVYLWWD